MSKILHISKFYHHIKMIITFTLLFFIPLTASAETVSIGKIVKRTGIIKKSNINCESDNCGADRLSIIAGDRIITEKNSEVFIILNDGTGIEAHENSDLIIFSIINKKDKTLTDLYSDYGKFKIIQHNDFLDTTLVFKTRTAIIKTVSAELSIITAAGETGIFVYKGEAGFAHIDPAIIKAYVIKSGYESFIKNRIPPISPVIIPFSLRSSWLNRHFLSYDKNLILKYNKKSGPVDWFFIEKN